MSERTTPNIPDLPTTLHGTAIKRYGKGVLILGPSGSGKSSLALQLMAYGAELIVDDLVYLDVVKGVVTLSFPPKAKRVAKIEARGVGLLSAHLADPAPLRLIIDLSQTETERLPDTHFVDVAGQQVRCFRNVQVPAFPAMIQQYLLTESD
jgi:HPr kinase/phosphorylase